MPEFTPDFSQWDNDPQCFQSYFREHYAPLLNKIADSPYNKIDLTDEERNMILYENAAKLLGLE